MHTATLTCYGCHRTLEPASEVLGEDGVRQQLPGDYSLIDGRPWCTGCQEQQRRECRPVATYAREVAGPSPYADWGDVYHEETHRGLDNGSHGGGGKSGRCKRKKAYSPVQREAWQP